MLQKVYSSPTKSGKLPAFCVTIFQQNQENFQHSASCNSNKIRKTSGILSHKISTKSGKLPAFCDIKFQQNQENFRRPASKIPTNSGKLPAFCVI
jgi:hypothetical protein